jgi:tetratricopeptide (TPR) repeat protein
MQLSRSNLLINNSDWQKGSEALDAYYISNNSDVRYWKIRGGLEQAQRQHEQARESYSEAYRRGRWTDIGILFSILTLERKIPGALTEAIYRDYESLVLAYGKAIERNDHFIALSPNVEAFLVTAKLLPVLCPLETDLCERSRASLELLSASADRNAAKERAMLEARPRGYLW